MMDAVVALYDRIVDPSLLVRRITIAACHVIRETDAQREHVYQQLDLFADPAAQEQEHAALQREKRRQQAVLHIRKKYGKNAIVKGMNLEEGATAMDRNKQIGGHKA